MYLPHCQTSLCHHLLVLLVAGETGCLIGHSSDFLAGDLLLLLTGYLIGPQGWEEHDAGLCHLWQAMPAQAAEVVEGKVMGGGA